MAVGLARRVECRRLLGESDSGKQDEKRRLPGAAS